jgi:hypothetical protein
VSHRTVNLIRILIGNGNGTIRETNPIRILNPCVRMKVADVNDDKRLDILVLHFSNQTIGVSLRCRNGTFYQPMYFSVGTLPSCFAISDFNRDRCKDIVVTNAVAGTISALLGFGNGSFMTQQVFSAGM